MLGWNISVKRQLDGGAAPATPSTACGPALAVWQSDIHGLEWLDALVAEGSAQRLEAGSMPTRYTARAADLLPRLQPQPPCAQDPWRHDPGDPSAAHWLGRTTFDHVVMADCDDDEWLLVIAWDEA